MVGTPDRVRYQCPECGRITYVSRRNGEVYSHNVPGRTPVRVCPHSGACVLSVESWVQAPPVTAPYLEPERGNSTEVSGQFFDQESGVSVRAVSAGLPGHGRRR